MSAPARECPRDETRPSSLTTVQLGFAMSCRSAAANSRLEPKEAAGLLKTLFDEAVEVDIRFFALLSAPVGQSLPEAEFTWDTCSDAPCVDVALPSGTWSFSFEWEDERWVLSDVVAP